MRRTKRMMMSMRVTDETRAQLEHLAPMYGGTMTDVVTVSVADLYRRTVAEKTGCDAVEPIAQEVTA